VGLRERARFDTMLTMARDQPLALRSPPAVAAAAVATADGAERAASWRATAVAVLPAFVVSRLIVLVAGAGSVSLWGTVPVQGTYDPRGLTSSLGGWLDTLVAPLARWDSAWLLDVAEVGYPAGYEPRTAFFPLYPLLVHALATVIRSPLLAGLVLSGACAFGGAMLVHRLAARELGERAATPAAWALLLFPGSLWLSAVYTEGLFLLLAAGCLLAARERRWAIAGALGALAAASRSAGVLLVIAVLLCAWQDERARDGAAALGDALRRAGPALAAAALVPIGLLAYLVALVLAGHPFTAPFDVQAEWGRETRPPWVGIWHGLTAASDGLGEILGARALPRGGTLGGAWLNLSLFACLVVAVVALVGAARRLPPAYAAFAGLALAMPLCSPAIDAGMPLMSLPRFVGVLFPLAMWAGWWVAGRGRAWAWGLAVPAALLLGLVAALTARWNFVA